VRAYSRRGQPKQAANKDDYITPQPFAEAQAVFFGVDCGNRISGIVQGAKGCCGDLPKRQSSLGES
jgi:hypothetical protein